jgi:hypothetical protein
MTLGHYFMESGDYQDTPISKILHFIQSVGLLEGWNRERCTIDLCKVAVQGPIKTYPLFIHSFVQQQMKTQRKRDIRSGSWIRTRKYVPFRLRWYRDQESYCPFIFLDRLRKLKKKHQYEAEVWTKYPLNACKVRKRCSSSLGASQLDDQVSGLKSSSQSLTHISQLRTVTWTNLTCRLRCHLYDLCRNPLFRISGSPFWQSEVLSAINSSGQMRTFSIGKEWLQSVLSVYAPCAAMAIVSWEQWKVKGKVVLLLNYAQFHEDVWGEWRYKADCRFPHLPTRGVHCLYCRPPNLHQHPPSELRQQDL